MSLVPISSLSPGGPISSDCHFVAVVTLLWPFASTTGQCALLLADPDFRKRHQRGQVRVRFAGPSARLIAKSRISIGDRVEVSLAGARWVDETADGSLVRTPGRGLDGELAFKNMLRLKVSKREGDQTTFEVEESELRSLPSQSTPTDAAPSTPAAAKRSRLSGIHMDDFGAAVYSSPAFMKRLRLSEGSFTQSTYSPVSEDDDLDSETSRKRRRISYKDVTEWKFDRRDVSPDKPVSAEVEEGEAPINLAQEHVGKGTEHIVDDQPMDEPVSTGTELETSAETSDSAAEGSVTIALTSPPSPVSTSLPAIHTRLGDGSELAQHDPSTPRLQPIGNQNLPLPSPFPTSAEQSGGPSPIPPAHELSTTILQSEPGASTTVVERVGTSTGQADPDGLTSTSLRRPEQSESMVSIQLPQSEFEEVQIIAIDDDDSDATDEALDRVIGVSEDSMTPPSERSQPAPSYISVTETHAQDVAIVPEQTSKMVPQASSVAGRVSTPQPQAAKIIYDTFQGMGHVPSPPVLIQAADNSTPTKSTTTAREAIAELHGPHSPGKGSEADVSSEDGYDEDELVSLQASDDLDLEDRLNLSLLPDHVRDEIDDQDLRALMEEELSSGDATGHDDEDDDREESERMLAEPSDDESEDDEDESREEDAEMEVWDEASASSELGDIASQPGHSYAGRNLPDFGLDGAAFSSISGNHASQPPGLDSQIQEDLPADEKEAWQALETALHAGHEGPPVSIDSVPTMPLSSVVMDEPLPLVSPKPLKPAPTMVEILSDSDDGSEEEADVDDDDEVDDVVDDVVVDVVDDVVNDDVPDMDSHDDEEGSSEAQVDDGQSQESDKLPVEDLEDEEVEGEQDKHIGVEEAEDDEDSNESYDEPSREQDPGREPMHEMLHDLPNVADLDDDNHRHEAVVPSQAVEAALNRPSVDLPDEDPDARYLNHSPSRSDLDQALDEFVGDDFQLTVEKDMLSNSKHPPGLESPIEETSGSADNALMDSVETRPSPGNDTNAVLVRPDAVPPVTTAETKASEEFHQLHVEPEIAMSSDVTPAQQSIKPVSDKLESPASTLVVESGNAHTAAQSFPIGIGQAYGPESPHEQAVSHSLEVSADSHISDNAEAALHSVSGKGEVGESQDKADRVLQPLLNDPTTSLQSMGESQQTGLPEQAATTPDKLPEFLTTAQDLSAPKTPTATRSSRKSLTGMMSTVPKSISAWFAPRRSSSRFVEKDEEDATEKSAKTPASAPPKAPSTKAKPRSVSPSTLR